MPQKLSLQQGSDFLKNVVEIPGDRVSFVAADGRTMFEVVALDDRTIEVRAVDACRLEDGQVRTGILILHPKCGNVIHLETTPYLDT